MTDRKQTLCDTCGKANVSCPVFPQQTMTCVEYAPNKLTESERHTMSEATTRSVGVQRLVSFQVRFGAYAVSTMDADSVWLEHESGEGVQVWNLDFERMLERLWLEEF